MRIFNRSTLNTFASAHPDADHPLRAWYREIETGAWASPADIKARYGSASVIRHNRIVFNIGGNKYRLIVRFRYTPPQAPFIEFIGTHHEYDLVDAETVSFRKSPP